MSMRDADGSPFFACAAREFVRGLHPCNAVLASRLAASKLPATCCWRHVAWRSAPDWRMIVLAQANLTAATADHRHVLCAHCAEWSPHCSLLKPQLVEAADRLAAQGADVLLAMVESRFEDEDQTEPIGTLSWYEDGTRMAYTGGRTASSITRWVQKRLAPKDELRRLAASTAP